MYLQTLFPRYIQATQEVVRIPKEVLKKALGTALLVRIKATKKHKVRSAFLFSGTPVDTGVEKTKLAVTSAVRESTKEDVSETLSKKDGTFVHTKPADVISLTVADVPHKENHTRYYLLHAHGFYTKLSHTLKRDIGDKWYKRLDSESRQLLKNLRTYKS